MNKTWTRCLAKAPLAAALLLAAHGGEAPTVAQEATRISARRAAALVPFESSESSGQEAMGDGSLPESEAMPALDAIPAPEVIPAPRDLNGARSYSLADFESLAVGNSPALAEASARVSAAGGRWLQAGLYPNPVIGYSGQQLGSGGAATQNGALIEQEFVTAGKLRKARESAGWDVSRTERELEAVRFRVLTDVRVGYYETLFAQRRQTVARDLVSINEKVVTSAQQLFTAGEAGRPDVLRAKIERDAVLIVLQNSENRLDAAWRRLIAAAGAPDLARAPLAGEPEEALREIRWDDALASILAESPELSAARATVQRAAWQVRLQRAKVFPNVTVQGIVQYDEAVEQTNANLMATIPIPLFNRNQGAIREALAEQVAAEAAFDRIALRVQRDLGLVYERYANSQFQSQKYARDLLPNARETLDLVQQGYDSGEVAFIDLLTAQRTYAEVYLSYIDALRETWIATAEIDGLLLSESLSGGSP